MTSNSSNAPSNPSRRDLLSTGAAALGAALLPAGMQNAQAQSIPEKPQPIAPNTPPAGYNILFVLVDQEHFFPKWPMPVPAREAIKKKAITFTNHQAASPYKRSPSQWPGTALSSASAGRSLIETASLIFPRPTSFSV